MSPRPERCRFPHKSWLTEEQARRKADDYGHGLRAYKCYDHWHIGRRFFKEPAA